MSSSPAPNVPSVKEGQVWKDNYDSGTGKFRHVRVLATALDKYVKIQACEPDGSDLKKGRSPVTQTQMSRFINGGKSGFTLIKDVVPSQTAPTGQTPIQALRDATFKHSMAATHALAALESELTKAKDTAALWHTAAMPYATPDALYEGIRALAAPAQSAAGAEEPFAWMSLNVATQKEHFGRLPLTSIQPGLYKHTKLLARPAPPAPAKDLRPCLHPIGLTTCGYTEDECMHEGSTEKAPPNGRHKYQPLPASPAHIGEKP